MADCSGFIEPLNLECWLVNTLSGNVEIFTFLSMIIIAALAARFRMPNAITLTMFALFGVIMAQYLGGLYIILVLLAGLATFYSISKIVR